MKETVRHKPFSRSFTRRGFISTGLKAGAAAFTTGLIPKLQADTQGQYNVMFIIVDDLRPLLRCYGHQEMHTPNIDRLAQRGTLFNRAYCQFPLCGPSRASIISGMRPDTTGFQNNLIDFGTTLPGITTLQQYFGNQGYYTHSEGKIGQIWGTFISGPSWRSLDVTDDELSDGKTAKRIEELLVDIKDKRFFLSVGFDKPHLPFYAPSKYYDLYDTEAFSLPVTSSFPMNSPIFAHNQLGYFRLYSDIPDRDTPISEEKTLELIRAYAASTSYMDAQVGRLLDQFDALNLTEKTVIIFCGDHGFHLGEHGTWRKNTLFEVSLRSPLIASIPGQTHPGTKTDALVELIDIYPTLCDVCQIPIAPELEGISFKPVLNEPTREWKSAAFSQLNRGSTSGRSIRTDRFRYTEWGNNGERGKELYDYYNDPNETINIANLSENSELVDTLGKWLNDGWQQALPHIQKEPLKAPSLAWDINNDGIVDIQDLLVIAGSFGADSPENSKVDVNQDGRVNILDLLIVAAHFSETTNPAAPTTQRKTNSKHLGQIEKWIIEARLVDDGSEVLKKGIATLKGLLDNIIPDKTILLPNYPNPFNPETWIPYDLGTDANVKIDIYNMKGQRVRQLAIGHQVAGTYRTQSRAAHWDGRNSTGEPVASGVYVYTLQAGKFKATRRMVILK